MLRYELRGSDKGFVHGLFILVFIDNLISLFVQAIFN